MYCSNCGKPVTGKFCSNCGAAAEPAVPPPSEPSSYWPDDPLYERLIATPAVRDMISHSASKGTKLHISAETFLKIADQAFKPAAGVSLSTIVEIAAPIAASLGLETGKDRHLLTPAPVGAAIVAVLCSLARRGHPIESVQQADDGCLLLAQIRSDLWTMGGTLAIVIRRQGTGSLIEATTKIKGQMYDWGKSKRVLDHLFEDIGSFGR